jgi:hypothetical protein
LFWVWYKLIQIFCSLLKCFHSIKYQTLDHAYNLLNVFSNYNMAVNWIIWLYKSIFKIWLVISIFYINVFY